jgi:hypothetical protein
MMMMMSNPRQPKMTYNDNDNMIDEERSAAESISEIVELRVFVSTPTAV